MPKFFAVCESKWAGFSFGAWLAVFAVMIRNQWGSRRLGTDRYICCFMRSQTEYHGFTRG